MKRIFLYGLLLCPVIVSGQDYPWRTWYGASLNPQDTMRVLNIFVNIVFDQCPTCDTLRDVPTPLWMPGPANSININPPAYLRDYMDVDFDPGHIRGSFTRRYAHASFNKFIVLGDKDSGALDQFIWLENHQIHQNGKEEFPAYWKKECKDDGVPGIYAYYQVGKNTLESNDINTLKPLLTDHLVPICADGNWDISLFSERMAACVAGGSVEIQDYYRENPLSGYNDLENHFFDPDTVSVLNWKKDRREMLVKRQNGVVTNKLANMGDDEDPFTGESVMNISSNPAPVNVVTWHHTRPDIYGTMHKSKRINNRRIHLSGLQIAMNDQHDGTFRVDVRWDFYDVTRDLLWTGDIVLHEKVSLAAGKSITFDQSYSPDKHIKYSGKGSVNSYYSDSDQ